QYYFTDLNSGKAQQMLVLNEKEFVQWDKNGLYAKEGEKLLLSKDEGKTWTTVAGGLKEAANIKVSPDGQWIAYSKEVHTEDLKGSDLYKDLPKTTAQVYTDLNYRRWDHWNFGDVSHVFVASINN